MFWFPGASIPSFLAPGIISVALYLAQTAAAACLMTFLFVVSGRSLLLAVMYHISFNTAPEILYRTLPEPTTSQELQVYVIGIVLGCILAVVLLARLGRRREQYIEEAEPAVYPARPPDGLHPQVMRSSLGEWPVGGKRHGDGCRAGHGGTSMKHRLVGTNTPRASAK